MKNHVLAVFISLLFLGSLTNAAHAGPERSPMYGCIECGQALLSCAEGVLSESRDCVMSCGGDTACLESCGDSAKSGISACKSSYEACKDSACTRPGGRP